MDNKMMMVVIRNMGIAVMVALLLSGCAMLQSFKSASPAGKVDATQAAQRIIAAYHVSKLLAQAEPVLTRSLMARLPKSVGANQRQRLKGHIDEVFRTQALTRDVRQRLVRQAKSGNKKRVLAQAAQKLESPLASRMLNLQRNAGKDGFADGYNAFLQQPLDAQRRKRLQLLRKLMDKMGVIDIQTAFKTTLLKTMVSTRNAITPAQKDVSQSALQQLLGKARRTMRNQMSEQVPLILLYVYRNIDDETLTAYVELQSSPAMVWANQALVGAVEAALADAGGQLSERVGQ